MVEHDNSSMQEFQKYMQALRVINSFARGPAKGNCRGLVHMAITLNCNIMAYVGMTRAISDSNLAT